MVGAMATTHEAFNVPRFRLTPLRTGPADLYRPFGKRRSALAAKRRCFRHGVRGFYPGRLTAVSRSRFRRRSVARPSMPQATRDR